jgi:hypothetical protein
MEFDVQFRQPTYTFSEPLKYNFDLRTASQYREGTRWHSWLRHCVTNRKVAGSILDGVTGIFQWLNPSGRIVAPGVDSACNRKDYQESFLGVKTAGA